MLGVADSSLQLGRTYDGIALSENSSGSKIEAFDGSGVDFYSPSDIASGIELSIGAGSTVTDAASFGGDRVYEADGSQITVMDSDGNSIDSISASGYDCVGSFVIAGKQYLSVLNSSSGAYGYIDLSDNTLTQMGTFDIGEVKGLDSYAKPGATGVDDVVFALCNGNGTSQYDAKTSSWIPDKNITINGSIGDLSDIYFQNDESGNIKIYFSTDQGFRGQVGVTDGTFQAIPVSATANGTSVSWLIEYGYTNDFDAADLDDPDLDGFVNWQEYQSDTNPTNGASFLEIDISRTNLSFEASSNCLYSIEWNDTLSSNAWNTLTNNVNGITGQIGISDPAEPTNRFYRLKAWRK